MKLFLDGVENKTAGDICVRIEGGDDLVIKSGQKIHIKKRIVCLSATHNKITRDYIPTLYRDGNGELKHQDADYETPTTPPSINIYLALHGQDPLLVAALPTVNPAAVAWDTAKIVFFGSENCLPDESESGTGDSLAITIDAGFEEDIANEAEEDDFDYADADSDADSY